MVIFKLPSLYLKVNNINVDFVVERDINIFIDLFKSSHRIISTAYHALVIGLIFGNEVYSAYLGDYYKIKIEGILNFYNICNQSIDFQMLKENENIMNNIFDDYYSFNEINEKSIEIAKNVKSLWSNIINEINSQ